MIYYYKELAYGIMEADISHYLPSANWRPKKANDVVWRPEHQKANGVAPVQVQMPEKQENQWCKF